jgi:Type II secretion system (T2SS), protein M subtype b
MNTEFTRRARRVVALILFASLLASVWLAVVEPLIDYMNTAAIERGISLRALKRNSALLLQSAAIHAAQTRVEQSSQWLSFYDSPAPEAAILQMEGDLRGIFVDSTHLDSMIAEPPVVHGALTRIAIRVTASVRIDQLADALERIQKQPRLLRVESLAIQAPELQGAQTNPVLAVQAEIVGVMIDRQAPRT